jgi:cytochrome P450
MENTAVPPTPRAHPILGSAIDVRRSQIDTYERAMHEHGDVVRLALGPPGLRLELYCLFHPDGVHRVLAGPRGTYTKRNRFYKQIAAAFGYGLLTTEGETWERQRRLTQPLFTRKTIATYSDVMAEEAALLADRWARNGNGVDANGEMVRLTLRVVGRAIFGDDVERAGEVLDWAFPILNRHMFRRATSPVATPESWPTPDNRRAARARRALDQVVDELVARRRASGANGEDLLSRLLSARDSETGQAMEPQEARDQALIFLLAGHETTSTALTFTFHLLGRHPDEQERVRAEVDSVLDGRAPTVSDVPALERTGMAIKEAMRLYPPAYALGRLLNTEDEIGGYRIPAGANVLVSQWATHRHPKFWPEPERFDPDRFTAEREAERHQYAYFPFGGGPRSCIGSHFAMLESVIAVAAVLQRYRIVSGPEQVALDTHGITLRPAGSVPLRVERR